MSADLIERFSRGLALGLSRRNLAGLAGLGVAARLTVAPGSDAKKKKKKKKKKTTPSTTTTAPPVTCTRQCSGKECGGDGCGGSCGACDSGEICQAGQCAAADAYTFIRALGSRGTGDGQFSLPCGVAVRNGIVAVTDLTGFVQTFHASGEFIARWGTQGADPGQFNNPLNVAIDGGGTVYVADTNNNRIQIFDREGHQEGAWTWDAEDPDRVMLPAAIRFDTDDVVRVLDYAGGKLRTLSSSGAVVATLVLSETDGAIDFALGSDGQFFGTRTVLDQVAKFGAQGNLLKTWGTSGTGQGQFDRPWGIAVDSSDNVYVTDTRNSRFQVFSSDGEFRLEWGEPGLEPGKFGTPFGIALDANHRVFIADAAMASVQIYEPAAARTARSATARQAHRRNRHARRRPNRR